MGTLIDATNAFLLRKSSAMLSRGEKLPAQERMVGGEVQRAMRESVVDMRARIDRQRDERRRVEKSLAEKDFIGRRYANDCGYCATPTCSRLINKRPNECRVDGVLFYCLECK